MKHIFSTQIQVIKVMIMVKPEYLQFTYSTQAIILRNSFTITFPLTKQNAEFLQVYQASIVGSCCQANLNNLYSFLAK